MRLAIADSIFDSRLANLAELWRQAVCHKLTCCAVLAITTGGSDQSRRFWRGVMNDSPADLIVASVTGEGGMGKNTGGRQRPTRQEVARLAYDRYEANGRKDGNDIEDWLLAEQELVHHYA
jgi:Protein of unknown function (DUF2934)